MSAWREANSWLRGEETRAKENPSEYLALFVPYILRQRRHIRRFLFSRFGVKTDYQSTFGDDTVKYPGLLGAQYLAIPERFPVGFRRCPVDRSLFEWFTAWSELLNWFDAAWLTIVAARAWATREGVDPDATAVEDLFEYHRMGPWMPFHTKEAQPLSDLRREKAENLAGWVGSHINLRVNKRLASALREEAASEGGSFEKLVEELVSTTIIAHDQLNTEERPIFAPGSGRTNLVSRVENLLEKLGNESSKLSREGRFADDCVEQTPAAADDNVEERDTLRYLVKKAKFTTRQTQVFELDMRTDNDTEAIAHELDIVPKTVRVLRKRYLDKLREAVSDLQK